MDRIENHIVRSGQVDGIKVAGFPIIFKERAMLAIGRVFRCKNISPDLEYLIFH